MDPVTRNGEILTESGVKILDGCAFVASVKGVKRNFSSLTIPQQQESKRNGEAKWITHTQLSGTDGQTDRQTYQEASVCQKEKMGHFQQGL